MTRPGIQRVTHADLLAAGVDLTGKSVSAIGIADNGRAVSRYVDDANGNEIFDAGDAIEFVGEVELTLYSDANLYVLTSDGSKVADARELAPSARGDVARTYTASYRAYPDNRYSASAPVGSIPWYDGLVRAIGKPSQLARTFDLPDLDAAAATGAALTIDLWGLSDLPGADDHHAVVSLNGVEIADTRFDGLVLDRIAVDLDPGILRAAGNELVVSLPFDITRARVRLRRPRRLRALLSSLRPGAGRHLDRRAAGGRGRHGGRRVRGLRRAPSLGAARQPALPADRTGDRADRHGLPGDAAVAAQPGRALLAGGHGRGSPAGHRAGGAGADGAGELAH